MSNKSIHEAAVDSILRRRQSAEMIRGRELPFRDAAIMTEGLTGGYGGAPIVRDVSFQLPRGSIFGLLGANGAGKTTLLRMLLGMLPPARGTIHLFSQRITGEIPRPILAGIGVLIEGPSLYEHLSGRQNVQIAGALRGLDAGAIEKAISHLSFGENKADLPAKYYSRGMKQWLAVTIAMMGNPNLVVLDEPLNGLDSRRIELFGSLIADSRKANGTTYLIVSHHFPALESLVDYVGVLGASGDLLYSGSRSKLSELFSSELSIAVRDTRQALGLLMGIGLTVQQQGSMLVVSGANEEMAEDINRRLTEAGLGVKHLSLGSVDLESLSRRVIANT